MIRLNIGAQPRWIDMLPGIRFFCAPCSSTVMGMAQESRQVQDLVVAAATNSAITVALAKQIGILTIREWEGVADEEGNALPVTPEAVDAAMEVYPIFEAFQEKVVAQGVLLADEKNGFAPSPNGTSAAAMPTVLPAPDVA